MEATAGGYSILVIDDSDTARAITRRHLEAHGYRVFDRSTPIGATRDIVHHRVDAVLIDLDMPVMRGDAFAALLRKNTRLSRVAVVLVSGSSKQELHEAVKSSNADGAVRKENAKRFLVPTIALAIRERRASANFAPAGECFVLARRAILDTPADGLSVDHALRVERSDTP
jgi:CheY-like chemotaxis protein